MTLQDLNPAGLLCYRQITVYGLFFIIIIFATASTTA